MPKKIFKTSNLTDSKEITKEYVVDLDKDVFEVFQYIQKTPRFYSQTTEPSLLSNDFAFWYDSDDNKYYLVVDFNGTQKKVELT